MRIKGCQQVKKTGQVVLIGRVVNILLVVLTLVTQEVSAQDNSQSSSNKSNGIWGNSNPIYQSGQQTEETNENPPAFGGEDDVKGTPIDGGLGLLLAAGVGLGARKLRKRKKENKKQ